MTLLHRLIAVIALAFAAPAWATDVYICKCDSTAPLTPHGSCSPGSDAVAIGSTTSSTPRATITPAQVNALAVGSRVLACKGGTWLNMNLNGNAGTSIYNPNASLASPLQFLSYTPSWGATARPWFHSTNTSQGWWEAGPFTETGPGVYAADGGYTFTGLKVTGVTSTSFPSALNSCFHFRRKTRGIVFDDMVITGCDNAIQNSATATEVNEGMTLKNSTITTNCNGVLGAANNYIIANNDFVDGNTTGHNGCHALYLGSSDTTTYSLQAIGNRFTRWSETSGVCTGGNVTLHGKWDGALFMFNTTTHTASNGGCYGYSITAGYLSAEWFRNVRIWFNDIRNVGQCITWTAAPNIDIMGNKCISTETGTVYGILGPQIGGDSDGTGDDADTGAKIRNNWIKFTQPGANSRGIDIRTIDRSPGTGLDVSNNVIEMGGTAARACFADVAFSAYAVHDYNSCPLGTNQTWSAVYATQSAARTAAIAAGSGAHANSNTTTPDYVATPSAANGYDCSQTALSGMVDTGRSYTGSRLAWAGKLVTGARDRGPCER